MHDPNNSLRLGDVLTIVPGWRTSRHKRHIVNRMILPAGVPLDQRPPIPTEDERLADRAARFAAKKRRKAVAKGERIEAAIRRAEEKLPKKIHESLHRFRNSGIGSMLRARGELDERLAKEEQKVTDKLAKWQKRFRESEYWTALKDHREKLAADEAMRRAKAEAEAAWAASQAAAVARSKAEGDAEVEPNAQPETSTIAADAASSPNEEEGAAVGTGNQGAAGPDETTTAQKSANAQKLTEPTEHHGEDTGPEEPQKHLDNTTQAPGPASETATSRRPKKD